LQTFLCQQVLTDVSGQGVRLIFKMQSARGLGEYFKNCSGYFSMLRLLTSEAVTHCIQLVQQSTVEISHSQSLLTVGSMICKCF
jgi:hypothetical protein